jgi:glucose-1-phosphate thymidylyltransferase
MNIIVPMAGMGKRMRPHTLTTAKPLLPVAGKPIVQRLVEGIAATVDQKLNHICFIIAPHFGEAVEKHLLEVAKNLGAEGHICYQEEALGTAHAVYMAKEHLTGPCIVGFADTLFRADFKIDTESDGVIWVQKVEDPSAFGVIKLDEHNRITDFIEKPETFVSDLAIIGIYYFKDGERLRDEITYLLENDIQEKGEYQITNALENMRQKGAVLVPGEVIEWLDCGNKNAMVYTNQRVLAHLPEDELVGEHVEITNSKIHPPCYIGSGVKLKNTEIGPYVSVGSNTSIEDSVIDNSIIQEDCTIVHADFTNSMLGNHVVYDGRSKEISISDYSTQTDG